MAANSTRVAMVDCACLLRISGDTGSGAVNVKISFTPALSFVNPDEVPVAHEVGLRLMHVLSLLPDEDFARKLDRLLAPYPVPDTMKYVK